MYPAVLATGLVSSPQTVWLIAHNLPPNCRKRFADTVGRTKFRVVEKWVKVAVAVKVLANICIGLCLFQDLDVTFKFCNRLCRVQDRSLPRPPMSHRLYIHACILGWKAPVRHACSDSISMQLLAKHVLSSNASPHLPVLCHVKQGIRVSMWN